MEKFFIVTNEKFLCEIEEYKRNMKIQSDFIKEFFEKHHVHKAGYYISGDGFVNKAFDEYGKKSIRLYIENCNENEDSFGNQLKKVNIFNDGSEMREFKKSSPILKEFQSMCVKHQLVINLHWHREGDYFKEFGFWGYSVSRFEHDGNYYLRISSNNYDTITPKFDGFVEIKGSEFYAAAETQKEQNIQMCDLPHSWN